MEKVRSFLIAENVVDADGFKDYMSELLSLDTICKIEDALDIQLMHVEAVVVY